MPIILGQNNVSAGGGGGGGGGGGYVVIDEAIAVGGETNLEVTYGDPMLLGGLYRDVKLLANIQYPSHPGEVFFEGKTDVGSYGNNNVRTTYESKGHNTTAPTYFTGGFGGSNAPDLNQENGSHSGFSMDATIITEDAFGITTISGRILKGTLNGGGFISRTGLTDLSTLRIRLPTGIILVGSSMTIIGLPR